MEMPGLGVGSSGPGWPGMGVGVGKAPGGILITSDSKISGTSFKILTLPASSVMTKSRYTVTSRGNTPSCQDHVPPDLIVKVVLIVVIPLPLSVTLTVLPDSPVPLIVGWLALS